MKILAVADEIAKSYYDHYREGILRDIDLIISCGDLPRGYLEFLVTMARCPLIYVRGNHDDIYSKEPPAGCICIEDRIYEYQGVRFLGLGGSCRYRPDGINMYTEKQMKRRISRINRKIFLGRWRSSDRNKPPFDVLVTHAAARGLGDLDTPVHKGFACFPELMDRYHPGFMVHGHVHSNYSYRIPRISDYHGTRIINACGHVIFEIPERDC